MIPDSGTVGLIAAFPWVLLLAAVISAARGDWKSKSVVQEQLKQKDDVLTQKDIQITDLKTNNSQQIADLKVVYEQRIADLNAQFGARLQEAAAAVARMDRQNVSLLEDLEDMRGVLGVSVRLAASGKVQGKDTPA